MFLECGEVDEVAAQSEGWHLIADLLLRLWCRFTDRQSNLLQDRLDLG